MAIIVRRKSVSKKKPAAPMETASLTVFIDGVSEYAKRFNPLKCYRGQRDASWPNSPGLLRPTLSRLEENEKRAVRDLVSVHPHEFATDDTMFDRLVRMQHFGLPTRLMDVSINPLVALYFVTDPGPTGEEADGQVTAFLVPEAREKYYDSDCVSCLANLANLTKPEKNAIIALGATRRPGVRKADWIKHVNEQEVYQRLHQFIRVEKPYFLPIIFSVDLFKPYYVHPKMSNRRILSQSGGFIIHGLQPTRGIRFAHVIGETRFIVPQGAKKTLGGALELIGINESTLFPELDRAAKRIEASYASK